ncbi:hypothetical protein BB558_001795 [Smittium angustum]|uniref:BHLH domain-containing protein n=1 Tax=Smittium angustum TaxID=133377 RepID=A0A2U1JAT6_SMIAN|nr:hypothetical protein BB558_001795 [Smittium angustum]
MINDTQHNTNNPSLFNEDEDSYLKTFLRNIEADNFEEASGNFMNTPPPPVIHNSQSLGKNNTTDTILNIDHILPLLSLYGTPTLNTSDEKQNNKLGLASQPIIHNTHKHHDRATSSNNVFSYNQSLHTDHTSSRVADWIFSNRKYTNPAFNETNHQYQTTHNDQNINTLSHHHFPNLSVHPIKRNILNNENPNKSPNNNSTQKNLSNNNNVFLTQPNTNHQSVFKNSNAQETTTKPQNNNPVNQYNTSPDNFEAESLAKRKALRILSSEFRPENIETHSRTQQHNHTRSGSQGLTLKRSASPLSSMFIKNHPEFTFIPKTLTGTNSMSRNKALKNIIYDKSESLQCNISDSSQGNYILGTDIDSLGQNYTNFEKSKTHIGSRKKMQKPFKTRTTKAEIKKESLGMLNVAQTENDVNSSNNSDSGSKTHVKQFEKKNDVRETLTEEEKRVNHIASERRRRNMIKKYFTELTQLTFNQQDDYSQKVEIGNQNNNENFNNTGNEGQNSSFAERGRSKPKISKAAIIEGAVGFIANLKNENDALRKHIEELRNGGKCK